ncbi:bifunctional 3,4-dihydroxy-2-butanone-4-phosphate synthase/GTP cyclohydrolase II [Thalassiella azotivora]
MAEQQPIRTDGVHRAVAEIAAGRPVVVLDAADRENEGDLVMAAELVTPQWLAFFVRHGSGYVCVPMEGERADALDLPLMVAENEESMSTAFTVTVDAREGVSTGISAADRATTVRLLADQATVATDLVRPGHVLPLRAREGGVLARPGHTEASVDLCRMAGLSPVGTIVELVDDDGSMRRAESCRRFADEHGLAVVTIAELVDHLGGHDALDAVAADGAREAAPIEAELHRGPVTRLPTRFGEFTAHGYVDATGTEHVALVAGDVADATAGPVPVRVHSECLTGDVLGSVRCDCGPQLESALAAIGAAGRGVLVYLRGHEGRGIGLMAKLSAYRLQDSGRDTVDANLDLGLPVDARDYAVAAHVLADLGVREVRLMTNNPGKVHGLASLGVDVVDRVGVLPVPHPENLRYLRTKAERMGHHLPHLEDVVDESRTLGGTL